MIVGRLGPGSAQSPGRFSTVILQLTLLAVDPRVSRLLALADGALGGRRWVGRGVGLVTHLVCGQTRPTVLTRTGVQTPVHSASPHTLQVDISFNYHHFSQIQYDQTLKTFSVRIWFWFLFKYFIIFLQEISTKYKYIWHSSLHFKYCSWSIIVGTLYKCNLRCNSPDQYNEGIWRSVWPENTRIRNESPQIQFLPWSSSDMKLLDSWLHF